MTCYFTGLEYGEGIEGTGVYFGIPGVGNPGYRLIDNRGALSDTLYPLEIARYVALQMPDAFAYELPNYSEETSNRVFGKWLNPKYDRPPVHCLALLTYSLLYPAARRFPNDDNTRHVRTEFKRMIHAITGISSIEWLRGCAPSFVSHPNHFIGIVDSKTVEWAEEMREKTDEGNQMTFGREMPGRRNSR